MSADCESLVSCNHTEDNGVCPHCKTLMAARAQTSSSAYCEHGVNTATYFCAMCAMAAEKASIFGRATTFPELLVQSGSERRLFQYYWKGLMSAAQEKMVEDKYRPERIAEMKPIG